MPKATAKNVAKLERRLQRRGTGLAGLVGHVYIPHPDKPGEKMIQYQFEIIRPVPPGRWLVQYFSWMDGRPTEVGVYDESFLLGEDVKLYLNHFEWKYAYERADQRDEWHAEERERGRERKRLKSGPVTAAELQKMVLPPDDEP